MPQRFRGLRDDGRFFRPLSTRSQVTAIASPGRFDRVRCVRCRATHYRDARPLSGYRIGGKVYRRWSRAGRTAPWAGCGRHPTSGSGTSAPRICRTVTRRRDGAEGALERAGAGFLGLSNEFCQWPASAWWSCGRPPGVVRTAHVRGCDGADLAATPGTLSDHRDPRSGDDCRAGGREIRVAVAVGDSTAH